jgi:peptide deformylase
MAIRQIRTIGDPILNKKCKEVKEVSERTKQLIDDMFETMYDANGVGLAAPQIGVLKRIVVIETDEENSYILINPVILEMDGEQVGYEGCLSVPGKTGIVKRPNHVKVKAFDENMQEFELEGEGLLARAICHECEHLEGELYVDKVSGELKDVSELEDEEEYIEAEA